MSILDNLLNTLNINTDRQNLLAKMNQEGGCGCNTNGGGNNLKDKTLVELKKLAIKNNVKLNIRKNGKLVAANKNTLLRRLNKLYK